MAQQWRRSHALGLARQSAWRASPSACSRARAGRIAGYEESPSHRRVKLVPLTPAGRAALGMIPAAQRMWGEAGMLLPLLAVSVESQGHPAALRE
jgi:hypothetical protein